MSPEATETDEKFGEEERERVRLANEDFYMDGEYLVFTAAYHRKRGYCCGSGCRHCPYPPQRASSPGTPSDDAVSDLAE